MKYNLYTIKIPQINLFGYHGCYDKEKKEGQEFEIDIEIVFKKNIICNDWRLENNCDYAKIVSAVREIFQEKRCDMLEELARNIGNKLFRFDDIDPELVKVNIKKFNPEGMSVPHVEVGFEASHHE